MRELLGRTVLISGASSDLGTACCLGVSKAGANVLLLDRKQRQMEGICQQIEANNSPTPTIIELDFTKAREADYQNLSESLANLTQTLDCVVHCGLAAWPLAPVINSKLKNWYQIYEREALQPMVLVRYLYPLLRKSRSASVVFCTMNAGRSGRANWGAVGAAFAALENISETLAVEWESQPIRVNTLDISNLPSALRTRYYPGEINNHLDGDCRLLKVLIDLLRTESQTNGQRMTP
ncbi:MAG: SDR family NAD(P)-dependent oxidoreductase [Gammaproteobacteria bacterium]|nr:SDR family NAD(P)-dependent oxidoreductase [Gammaproteobacteria bacterium]MCY4218992.1 SDR family NAD(P)-dependent oxidoreductase [Gammaproteobacteria bacterium]MCY4274972.1 SDR family NAD(P)-dependent oxidoreductase [Gammaproteobacteria bacterium]